jgi:hypothetical protein
VKNVNWRMTALLILASAVLTACGGADGTETETTSGQSPQQTPPNTAPVISGTPATTALSGSAYTFQPAATDSDNDRLTFSASGLPAWASINAQTGLIHGTPSEADVGTTASILVSVSDGEAGVSLPGFIITIASSAPAPIVPVVPPSVAVPTNVAPSISGTPQATVQATTAFGFAPSASDPDSQSLTFSISNKPSWASFSTTTGALSGTPTATDVRSYSSIVISVSDGTLSASLPAFSITVTAPPNRAPTITGTAPANVQATAAYGFTPAAFDPDSQALTFSIANKPSWVSFSTTTGALSGTPAAADVRTYSNIVITASDGSLSASLPAFSITVTAPPNRAPTITGTAPTSVTANAAYSFSPTGADADGQTLAYSITNKPAWATFSTSTGRLSGTPTSANVGTFSSITITASDGALSASLTPFSITVNAAPNVAPTIAGTPSGGVVAGTAYSFTPTASDADGNTLGFSITGKPSWATFATSTGKLTGTPTTAQAGTYANIVISVSDGTASQALPPFTITVSQPAPSGTAALTWTAPTQNTDGSALSDLAGYRVYRGSSASALNEMTVLPGASSTSHTYTQLTSGTHYFAVTAYTVGGVESALSAVGSKTIP